MYVLICNSPLVARLCCSFRIAEELWFRSTRLSNYLDVWTIHLRTLPLIIIKIHVSPLLLLIVAAIVRHQLGFSFVHFSLLPRIAMSGEDSIKRVSTSGVANTDDYTRGRRGTSCVDVYLAWLKSSPYLSRAVTRCGMSLRMLHVLLLTVIEGVGVLVVPRYDDD
jgi:hypothetical protein